MKNFSHFIAEVYDRDVMGSSQIKKSGEGGRVGADRRKTTPERRRVRAIGGGKTEPVEYKDRKDIGTQRQVSTRQQQPTQERGSAEVKQSYADKVKAERRKAAQARAAARASGGTEAASKASKTSSREAEKVATKLLTTKKKEEKKTESKPRRDWKTDDGGGMTRKERDAAKNKEQGAKLKARKAELIKDFTEKNGRAPKGIERTKLVGLAHKSVKAGI